MNSFLKQFLKKPLQIGAVAPLSSHVRKSVFEEIDFTQPLRIVELGAGTGTFTKHIIQHMNDQTMLYSFEIDKDFVEILHQEIVDPRVQIYHASATDISQYVTEPVDIVVSTLPLSNMDDALVERILQASKDILKPEGHFFQCQYSKRSLKNLQNIFTTIDVKFEPLNLPPAFIYKCKH